MTFQNNLGFRFGRYSSISLFLILSKFRQTALGEQEGLSYGQGLNDQFIFMAMMAKKTPLAISYSVMISLIIYFFNPEIYREKLGPVSVHMGLAVP